MVLEAILVVIAYIIFVVVISMIAWYCCKVIYTKKSPKFEPQRKFIKKFANLIESEQDRKSNPELFRKKKDEIHDRDRDIGYE